MNANAQENKDEQSELELKKLQEQKSVWESDLADKSRFTLNLKLNAQERSLARSHAKSVTSNLQKNNFYVHYLLTIDINLCIIYLCRYRSFYIKNQGYKHS